MTMPQTFDKAVAHRAFAVENNNLAWDLLERAGRSDEEDRVMLDAAHTARLHWSFAGEAIHALRASCLVACVHAALGLGASALNAARHSEALADDTPEGLADWDLPFVHDALARAFATLEMETEAMASRERARDAGDLIADAADREVFDRWFATNRPPTPTGGL
ncbi:MAG: hypothetical protein CME07_03235 [Gemmatimonadetes bacterium]|jgi:hypothetical protein|nr:hypothetical protein [Gemmatimonadota bacterium]